MVITNQGDSKVGKAHLYESGDQKNLPRDQRTADADLRRKVGTEERSKCHPSLETAGAAS